MYENVIVSKFPAVYPISREQKNKITSKIEVFWEATILFKVDDSQSKFFKVEIPCTNIKNLKH